MASASTWPAPSMSTNRASASSSAMSAAVSASRMASIPNMYWCCGQRGVSALANLGAYLAPKGLLSPTSNTPGLSGSYRTPAIHATVRGIFSNTVPTDVYRGAGRPEAFYLLERLVDAAARELGIDPAELRRRNMVTPAEMPFRTPFGLVYDHGDLPKVLDGALAAADWTGFGERRAAAAQRGKLRGIGLGHYTERVAGGSTENAAISLDENGKATALLG